MEGNEASPIKKAAYRSAADIDEKPIAWLWPGGIARGKPSLIAGPPGVAKSQATIYMAALCYVNYWRFILVEVRAILD